MIDPTVLRQSVNEHLQNHLAYPADVMAWVMKCGDLLDENAALRAHVRSAEGEVVMQTVRRDQETKKARGLESRLAALKEAGEKVVAEIEEFDSALVWDSPALDAFKAELRSDP